MKKVLISGLIAFVVIVAVLPYMFIEINTFIHYDETVNLYQSSTMLSSDNYHKVINYSDDNAKILYCEPSCVFLCDFTKTTNGEWICKNYKPVLKKGALTEADFYPIYPTKHLILPEESKENFEYYKDCFEGFATTKGLQYSVVISENGIDCDISLVADNTEIVVSLFNDYDGLSGFETAKIAYYSSEQLDLRLLMEIQQICMHKTFSENEIQELIDSNVKLNGDVNSRYEIANTKDMLGNGEYLITYSETKDRKMIILTGLTKRDNGVRNNLKTGDGTVSCSQKS